MEPGACAESRGAERGCAGELVRLGSDRGPEAHVRLGGGSGGRYRGRAARPVAVQVEDIAAAEARLLERFEDLPAAAWAAEVAWPSGTVRTADQIVTARLNELEVHHVDLGLGYTFDDVPAESRDVLLTYVTSRWPDDFDVVLRSSDSDWSSPARPGGARIITGGSAALLKWALGRGTLSGDVPTAPPWG